MRIGGIDPKDLPAEEVLVIPRGEQQIVFKARGVSDYEEFHKLCPEPKPPGRLTKDGWVPNEEDESYQQIVLNFSRRRMAYMAIKSLEPSAIEWDHVVPGDPSTWLQWESDLRDAGLNQVEINRVVQLVWEANCLDEAKLERARKVFLRGQRPMPGDTSGPSIERPNTSSGEVATD